MRIGLIGAGAIGHFLLKEMNQHEHQHEHGDVQIKSILVSNREKYQWMESKFGVVLFTDLDLFLESRIDIVVEAANINTVQTLIPSVIKKKDCLLISVGALADQVLLEKICTLADQYNHLVHLPSGAIGGLDLIQNANALGSIESVTLTTTKPAESLIDEEIDQAKLIFEGKAVDAIKLFPKNLNVSIILSLAGLGIDKTNVRLIADPYIDKNIHSLEVKGDFGEATVTIKNNPFPENPKTSYLAAMSILGTLKRIKGKVRIGG